MKHILKIISCILVTAFFLGCQEEDQTFGNIVAPTNIVIMSEIVGQDAANPNGDGSGLVNFTATADNALSYKYSFGNTEQNAPLGETSFTFSDLGVNTYTVTVVAYGTGGVSTTATTEIDVLATYSAPADLLEALVGNGSKTWRIKSEKQSHFGLGPVGGLVPAEWYGAAADEKSATGMYDDRYVFNEDGTFTHIVNSTNDDPTADPTGTIFGRDPLVEELGPHSETVNGSDIENYPYQDYTENWVLTAPGGVETINLTGLGFIGYYTGGNHKYEIFSRDNPNELTIRTSDGNSEFDWWFIITSEEEGVTNQLQTIYTNLVWSDEFDVNGAPDPANWTYDLGVGENGWGNNELQEYTDNADNVIVEDGSLKITAKAEGSAYTSARLKSVDLFEFTYGRVEVRAKLPAAQGTWPAIWMLGANFETVGWPASGEIDIMEQTGQDKNTTLGTLHYPAMFGGNGNTGSTSVATSTTAFHNYVVEWTPDVIKIVVDDVVFHTVINSDSLPFNDDFFFILNVAMGGSLGGTVDPAFTEDTMEIDYVRVYQ
ncbi:family 16 glycosylhydrolase [Olleya sp. HaHaR_3_96]|uniref:glycoside hydrolase family 16 protein n=1 Tax=Olleya sp. HaHaR_3_96 TaxID=2745560 RepID=UPI001C4FCEC6|nr:glycoside hydrolase family 16 protein [Olleya sp. HaHaR_3_96]QXP59291.1 glycoside hydrolase family 16 protein [Olleya sp. HaHaR_3_96]